jgi:hypothetical protein
MDPLINDKSKRNPCARSWINPDQRYDVRYWTTEELEAFETRLARVGNTVRAGG